MNTQTHANKIRSTIKLAYKENAADFTKTKAELSYSDRESLLVYNTIGRKENENKTLEMLYLNRFKTNTLWTKAASCAVESNIS